MSDFWRILRIQLLAGSWPRIHQLREGFCIQNSPFPWGQDCWPWCSCTFGHSRFLLERVELRFNRKSNFLFLSLKPQNHFFQDIAMAIHLVFLCLWSLQEAHTSLAQNWAVCVWGLPRMPASVSMVPEATAAEKRPPFHPAVGSDVVKDPHYLDFFQGKIGILSEAYVFLLLSKAETMKCLESHSYMIKYSKQTQKIRQIIHLCPIYPMYPPHMFKTHYYFNLPVLILTFIFTLGD